MQTLTRNQKILLLFFFSLFWVLWRLPYFKHLEILNGDYAINYIMAHFWFREGPYKFMWGNQYLGTLETFWNALWFLKLPLEMPYLKIPNAILALLADICFLFLFLNRSKFFVICLSLFLVFFPNYIRLIDPQLVPGYSYSVLCLLIFLALLLTNTFARGFLLSLAFYTQPIAVYFIAPVFLYYFLQRQWKQTLLLVAGFLPPFLFTVLPWGGAELNFKELSGKVGERLLFETLQLFAHNITAFFGLLSDFMNKTHSVSFILLMLIGFIGLKIFTLKRLHHKIYTNKIFKMEQVSLSEWVFLISFLLIPLLFIIRKYEAAGFDVGISRYLWLWHFPLYYIVALLFEKIVKYNKKPELFALALFFPLFIALSLFRIPEDLRQEDPNQNLRTIVSYLREQKSFYVIGDYWDVYPLSFFSIAESKQEEEQWIISRPFPGAIREYAWAKQVESAPEIYFLCRGSIQNCEKTFVAELKLKSKKFIKSNLPSIEFSEKNAEPYSLQKYEMDEANFLIPVF